MGEFFKGWRRKVGVLTLAVSCVFMAGWVRSYSNSITDLTLGEYAFCSVNGTLEIHDLAHWKSYHFETSDTGTAQIRTIPQLRLFYWPIVIPLTLLSAYLLLAKPRVAKPKKTIEPDRA